MDRRKFIKQTAAMTALPAMVGGFPIHTLARDLSLESVISFLSQTDRVLVLVQLNGGNDGLNTVIPLDQYSNLYNARPDIIIPSNDVLSLNGLTGLHPSMTGLHNMYQNGKMAVVQNTGYDNPNFSHFRATDIWTTGSPSDQVYQTGWIGRYLDSLHPTYPTGYPNTNHPDPLAITIGSVVSNTCQGQTSSLGMAIKDPDEFIQLLTGGTGQLPSGNYGKELGFIRQTQLQTNAYLTSIQTAAGNADNISPMFNNLSTGNRLGAQLAIVSRLIAGGLKTRFYIVNIGGFDTHANQVTNGAPTVGAHANLLRYVSESIDAFQDDLKMHGIEDQVLGMTFSEFGRRIKSNGSIGTDHGAAAPMFLFGSKVNAQVYGSNPVIPATVDTKDSIPRTYDFRDIYGSVLLDWFCVDEQDVKDLLFDNFQYHALLNSTCSTTPIDEELQKTPLALYQNYPNPFDGETTVKFKSEGGVVNLSIYDNRGVLIQTLTEQFFAPGVYERTFDGRALPSGNYYVRMSHNYRTATKVMVLNR
ncbi:MAG: DUF1501 domain-containing protein [Bacteroidota bacterium]